MRKEGGNLILEGQLFDIMAEGVGAYSGEGAYWGIGTYSRKYCILTFSIILL